MGLPLDTNPLLRAATQKINGTTPHNTKRLYNATRLVFIDFCQQLYHGDATVTDDKLFAFMWYEAFRKKKTTKRKKGEPVYFDLQDFLNVVKAHPFVKDPSHINSSERMDVFKCSKF